MQRPARPKAEDYGLTDSELDRLRKGEHLFDKAAWTLLGAAVLTVVVATIVLGQGREEDANAIIYGWFSFLGGCVLYGLLGPTARKLVPAYRKFARYLAAEKAYQAAELALLRTLASFWLLQKGASLEREAGRLFTALGYSVRLTPATGDKGIDLFLERNGRRYIAQCKGLGGPAGPAILRDLYGTLMDCGADSAFLVSTNGITRGGRAFISGKPIEILDASDLATLEEACQVRAEERQSGAANPLPL